jgi:hypothetical protein
MAATPNNVNATLDALNGQSEHLRFFAVFRFGVRCERGFGFSSRSALR